MIELDAVLRGLEQESMPLLIEYLSATIPEIFDVPGRSTFSKGAPEPPQKINWTTNDIPRYLHWCAVSGERITRPPESIDFSGIGNYLGKLKKASCDGNEYGCMAFTGKDDGQLSFRKVYRGNSSSVGIGAETTSGRWHDLYNDVPTLMIHTHPVAPHERPADVYHFSPEDFIALMEDETIQMSAVLAPGAMFMLLKTDRTVKPSRNLEQRLDHWLDAASSDLSVPFARRLMRFTKFACEQLGLELYIARESRGEFHARRARW